MPKNYTRIEIQPVEAADGTTTYRARPEGTTDWLWTKWASNGHLIGHLIEELGGVIMLYQETHVPYRRVHDE